MAERRLLVLGAGPAQVGLLAAARRRGIVSVAADRDPAAPGFRYAARRALVDAGDETALARLARAERVDGIVAAGSDRLPAVAARVAARLGLPHPLRPDTAHLPAARQRERAALAASGIPVPAAVVCRSLVEVRRAAERLGFPCRICALDRPGGVRVAAPPGLAESVALATADSRVTACLVEELPAAVPLVVVGAATPAGLRPLLVADDDERGPVWPAAAPPSLAAAAAALAGRAVAALGIVAGPVEVRVSPDLRVLSASPRLGRNHEPELCRAATGVDLTGQAIRAALGEEAVDAIPRERAGAACIRFLPAPGPGEELAGVEQAFAAAGVAGIRTYRGRDRGGAVLATGADRTAALAAAERALALIRLERLDAEAVA